MKTFDHRIAKTFGAWMPFIVCFTLGCGGTDMPSAATSLIVVDGEANSVNDAAAPMELFFFIADGLSSDIRQNLKTHLGSLLKTLPGGSIIQVVRTPDHRAMATLVIPHTTGRERLRDKSLTLGLTPVIALLQDNGVVPEDFRGQLSLDQLATTFWGLRASDHKCRITLVGTPIYHDPDLAQWNFGTTRFPSDSSLTHPDSTLPFRRHGRNAIPSDVEVVWILPKDDWGNGKLREDAILRFYRQAFVLGIGGDFLRMTSDMDAAFERQIQSGFPDLEVLIDPLPPRMIEMQPQQAPAPAPPQQQSTRTTATSPPPDIAKLFREVAADPTRTLIAINWTSDYMPTDLDLWIGADSGLPELCFRNMNTPFGYLIRDVRQTGDIASTDIIGRWEVAVLTNVRPNELDCWLNAYDADGSPIHVKLVTIWNGRESTREFDLNVAHGDKAMAALHRQHHVAWTRLKFPDA